MAGKKKKTIKGIAKLFGDSSDYDPNIISEEKVNVDESKDQSDSDVLYGILEYPMTYVRSINQPNGRVLKIITIGSKLELLGKNQKGWIKVRTVDTPIVEGYVKSAFIKRLK